MFTFQTAESSLYVLSFRRFAALVEQAGKLHTLSLDKDKCTVAVYEKHQSVHRLLIFIFAFSPIAVIKHSRKSRTTPGHIYDCGSLLVLVGVHFYRSTVLETGFTLRGELSTPFHLPVCCHGNRGGY